MCTVTFIAQKDGYCLGMNRDEKRSRAAGLPPTRKKVNGRAMICPSEPGGGTWIALNDAGATLALINWYSVTNRVERNPLSRGEVVKIVSAADSPAAVNAGLSALPLKRINPFRLIGIFPALGEVVEWRWNLKRLIRKNHPWTTRQWASSGFNEPMAQRVRGATFRKALRDPGVRNVAWLRRLHGSHDPQVGPFSTCMHRSEAATVSYTEVSVTTNRASMRYHDGAPCQECRSSRLLIKRTEDEEFKRSIAAAGTLAYGSGSPQNAPMPAGNFVSNEIRLTLGLILPHGPTHDSARSKPPKKYGRPEIHAAPRGPEMVDRRGGCPNAAGQGGRSVADLENGYRPEWVSVGHTQV